MTFPTPFMQSLVPPRGWVSRVRIKQPHRLSILFKMNLWGHLEAVVMDSGKENRLILVQPTMVAYSRNSEEAYGEILSDFLSLFSRSEDEYIFEGYSRDFPLFEEFLNVLPLKTSYVEGEWKFLKEKRNSLSLTNVKTHRNMRVERGLTPTGGFRFPIEFLFQKHRKEMRKELGGETSMLRPEPLELFLDKEGS